MRWPCSGPPSQAGCAEVGRRRLGQALARLVGGEALRELAAHQQRDRELDARAAVVGIERQRAAEAADGFVEAAEVAQAERQIEEALAIVAVERDRLEVMLHRLVELVAARSALPRLECSAGLSGSAASDRR